MKDFKRMNMRISKGKISKGFGLLEVLIAMLIVSIGFLGIAGLNASYSLVQDAINRQTAMVIAMDLSNRIRMNRAQAANYPGTSGSTINCTTSSCTATQLVQFDMGEINSRLAAYTPPATATASSTPYNGYNLPNGTVRVCISNTGTQSNSVCISGGPSVPTTSVTCNGTFVAGKLLQNPNRYSTDTCGGTTGTSYPIFVITVTWTGLYGRTERYVSSFTP